MSYFLPDKTREALYAAFRRGETIRQAMRSSGVTAIETARRYRRLLIAMGEDLRCPCGEPAGHQGWCYYRYANSPKRQAYQKSRSNWSAETYEYLAAKRRGEYAIPPSLRASFEKRHSKQRRDQQKMKEIRPWLNAKTALGLVRQWLHEQSRGHSDSPKTASTPPKTSRT